MEHFEAFLGHTSIYHTHNTTKYEEIILMLVIECLSS